MNILVAGDYCPKRRVAKLFERENFEPVLGEIVPFVSASNYSIVNFECPISTGEEKPIKKCGPNLYCSNFGMKALKWAGFNCVTLANNHINDYGKEGISNTINTCCFHNIDFVGGGMNLSEASKTLYKKISGETLAVINCCEHEFSIATTERAGSNPLSPINQYYAILEAKGKADYVIVIVHGGHEHHQLPSLRMQDIYRFFIDSGADVVLNHHQHCYSGYEIYKGKPIFYGIGNFCFDKGDFLNDKWNTGYMVSLNLTHESINFRTIPYKQCDNEPKVHVINTNEIQSKLEKLNDIIKDRRLLEEETQKYYSSLLNNSKMMIEPVSNRFVRALQKRHLLPGYHFSEKYLLRLYDYLLCESHRDRINYFLESEYNKKSGLI